MLSRTGARLRAWDPLGFWRHPKRALRRWTIARRGWPKPAELEAMTWDEREAYFHHIGLDERVAKAVASSDARRAAEADTGVRGK